MAGRLGSAFGCAGQVDFHHRLLKLSLDNIEVLSYRTERMNKFFHKLVSYLLESRFLPDWTSARQRVTGFDHQRNFHEHNLLC